MLIRHFKIVIAECIEDIYTGKSCDSENFISRHSLSDIFCDQLFSEFDDDRIEVGVFSLQSLFHNVVGQSKFLINLIRTFGYDVIGISAKKYSFDSLPKCFVAYIDQLVYKSDLIYLKSQRLFPIVPFFSYTPTITCSISLLHISSVISEKSVF